MSNYTPTSPNTIGRIRAELDKIADAIEDKLDRTPDEGQVNQMEADLDVNSNKLLNVGDADLNSDGVNLGQVKEVLENAGVSGGSIISETPPTTPTPGLRWTRCTDMVSFIWYEDDDGGQWIEDNPSVGGVSFISLPTYVDDTAAGLGGLTADALYKTPAGEVRVKL